MNNPALKREVSRNKMLKLTKPGLRRSNVMLNSFSSGVSNTPKEFSRTPEMSFSKIVSKPRMFFKKLKGAISFKKLKGFANTHSWGQLNKQVDMVNSDVKLIDSTFLPESNFPNKELTIHSEPVELKGVFGIFNFPHKVECVLSEAVFSGFQIHFLSPKSAQGDKAHANFFYFEEPSISAPHINYSIELNIEEGDSSLL